MPLTPAKWHLSCNEEKQINGAVDHTLGQNFFSKRIYLFVRIISEEHIVDRTNEQLGFSRRILRILKI